MMESFGQLKQDLLALEFFNKYPPEHKIFLDVGAFDGVHFSNTHLFYKKGWSGLCVEACSKNYKKLEALYMNSNIKTVLYACADYEGEAELNIATIPGSEGWGSDVSSLGSDVLSEWDEYRWEKETVRVKTMDAILEEENIFACDYLSIDVEGFELPVLKGLDLRKFKPSLIISEYQDAEARKELIIYLQKFGYVLIYDNQQDVFFIRFKLYHLPFVLKYVFKMYSGFFKKVINKINRG